MSQTNVDAAFDFVTHALSPQEQFALAQKLLIENSPPEPAGTELDFNVPMDAETMRRQREALERFRGKGEGPEDLSLRHDAYLYGQGKP